MKSLLFEVLSTQNPEILDALTAKGWPEYYSLTSLKWDLYDLSHGQDEPHKYPILFFRKFNREIAEELIFEGTTDHLLKFFATSFMTRGFDSLETQLVMNKTPTGESKTRVHENIKVINGWVPKPWR